MLTFLLKMIHPTDLYPTLLLLRPLLIQEHQLKLALVSLHPPVLLFLLLK